MNTAKKHQAANRVKLISEITKLDPHMEKLFIKEITLALERALIKENELHYIPDCRGDKA